jgi:hypothetical protein
MHTKFQFEHSLKTMILTTATKQFTLELFLGNKNLFTPNNIVIRDCLLLSSSLVRAYLVMLMILSHEKVYLPFDIVFEKLMVILLHLSRYIYKKCQIDDEA